VDWLLLIFGAFTGYHATTWWRQGNPVDVGMMTLALVGAVIHLSA